MSAHVVLVPGFWLGAWAWDPVVAVLRDAGHAVTAVTLPGLESVETDRSAITLEDHAQAIVAALEQAAGDRRVLVLHSGAASPGTVVMDRRPDLVDHVVWVDTGPAADGWAMDPDFAGDEMPLPSPEGLEEGGNSVEGIGEADLATFRERAVPQPAGALRDAPRLTNPARFDIPTTAVCTSASAEQVRQWVDQGVPFVKALADHRVEYVDLPTGHWPMWSRPQELAEIIDRVARGEVAAGD